MKEWNSQQYLKFEDERTQPSLDLAGRIAAFSPLKAVDIGCGPGNSTNVLKKFFPKSDIVGIDNSQNMIEKARKSYPELKFDLCSAENVEQGYDLIFSNACLQWIPDHKKLIPELFGKLTKDGVLAVQVPNNFEEPLYTFMEKLEHEPQWGFSESLFEGNRILPPLDYFDILSSLTDNFEIWETVYYHKMQSQSFLEWVRGTRLRPFLEALSESNAKIFEEEILRYIEKTYKPMKNGDLIFKFRRLFFTAVKN